MHENIQYGVIPASVGVFVFYVEDTSGRTTTAQTEPTQQAGGHGPGWLDGSLLAFLLLTIATMSMLLA